MMFSTITKQNGYACVWDLYRKVFGRILFPCDRIYKFEKRVKVRHVLYSRDHKGVSVAHEKITQKLASLIPDDDEAVSVRQN